MDTGHGTGTARGHAPSQPQHAQMSALAAHLNQQTRGAKKAQRDCADLYLLLSLHSCASTPTTHCHNHLLRTWNAALRLNQLVAVDSLACPLNVASVAMAVSDVQQQQGWRCFYEITLRAWD